MEEAPAEVSQQERFTAWVQPSLVAMSRFAHRLVGPGEADDVVQEALVRAWRRWSTFDPTRGTPTAWLLAIVADRARRHPRPRHVLMEAAHASAGPVDLDLERAIARLPERQRIAVTLFYFVDLDVAAIAEVMDIAPGTVKATLHRGRERLRTLIGDDHA